MPYLKAWWRIYKSYIEPLVKETVGDDHVSESVLSLPSVVSVYPSQGSSQTSSALADPSPPDAWDYGRVDYTGRDRFDNIQKHLDSMISKDDGK